MSRWRRWSIFILVIVLAAEGIAYRYLRQRQAFEEKARNHWLRGQLAYYESSYRQAITEYATLVEDFSASFYAVDGLYELAHCYYLVKDYGKAYRVIERLNLEHPGSFYQPFVDDYLRTSIPPEWKSRYRRREKESE